jgi:hypothetical protein
MLRHAIDDLQAQTNPVEGGGPVSNGTAHVYRVFEDPSTGVQQVLRDVSEAPGQKVVFESSSFPECLQKVNNRILDSVRQWKEDSPDVRTHTHEQKA